MLTNHDLAKLEQRGFRLEDERVMGQLDGVSAILPITEALRVQIYQGCVGVYKLQGQGRGRPKANVLVDVEWFEPHWYIRQQDGQDWSKVADGCQVSVDLAVDEAFGYLRRLFPDVPIPAGVA